MASPSLQDVQLQLVMAFGQGTGSMMATPQALLEGLSAQSDVIRRALPQWNVGHLTVFALVRLAGQIAAVRAAEAGVPQIETVHVMQALQTVLGLCPCSEIFDRK